MLVHEHRFHGYGICSRPWCVVALCVGTISGAGIVCTDIGSGLVALCVGAYSGEGIVCSGIGRLA